MQFKRLRSRKLGGTRARSTALTTDKTKKHPGLLSSFTGELAGRLVEGWKTTLKPGHEKNKKMKLKLSRNLENGPKTHLFRNKSY